MTEPNNLTTTEEISDNSRKTESNKQSKKSRVSNANSLISTASTSHSDQEEKKHVSEKDLKEFRAKTLDRIVRKRREYDAKYIQYTDERRKEVAAFRMHWKENLKRQRLETVLNEVDKRILRDIYSVPIADINGESLKNILKLRKENEERLHLLTADLDDVDEVVPYEKRKDSGVYTISLKKPGILPGDDNNFEGRKRSASIEFNSGRRLSVGAAFLQYISSYDLSVRSKIHHPWEPIPKLKFDTSSEKESRKLTNKLQIMELLDDLLVSNPQGGKTPAKTRERSNSVRERSNSIASRAKAGLSTQNRLPKGLMLEVFQEILNNPSARKMSRSFSFDDSVNFAKTPFFASAMKDSRQDNPTLSSLIDGCFLIGPDQSSIIDLMNDRISNPPSLSSKLAGNSTMTDSTINAVPSMSGKWKQNAALNQTKHVLVPKVLFRSEFHFPPEMLQLLPSYCFPSDVEVTLDTAQVTKPPPTARLTRRESRHSIIDPADPTRKSKKFRIFFPSDENLKSDEIEATKEANNALSHKDSILSTVLTNPTLSSVFKAPFIILLGDHTYQQYCLGFHIPVVFFDPERGFTVQTTYTLCFLTKFAFFSFLTYFIQQLDEDLRIFTFKESLPEFDPSFPMPLQLKLLNELVIKLKKILIPLYPYLVLRNDYHSPPEPKNNPNSLASGTNNKSNNGSAASGNNNTNNNYIPSPNFDASSAEYLAIINDLTFSLNMKNTSADKKLFEFRRTFYQKYYSLYLSPTDLQLDPSSIHFYEKNPVNIQNNSSMGKNHALEKDREDSFFVLQWALPTLLKHLPLDQIILALGCAMTEMKVIVKHKDLHVVSSVILAMVQLLKPLKWCSPVIVTLPDQLTDLIESPVPIMLGLQKLPPGWALPERYVVVDPGERIVHLNPFDLVQAQSILLPNGSRLVAALRPSYDAILKYNSRAKKARIKNVTISPIQIEKSAGGMSSTMTSPVNGPTFSYSPLRTLDSTDLPSTIPAPPPTAIPPPPPTLKEPENKVTCPLELDYDNPDCISFLGHIKQFVSTVHNHILAIVNTTIHLQHVEKQAARAKRRVVANKTLDTLKNQKNPKKGLNADSLDVGVGSFDNDQKKFAKNGRNISPFKAANVHHSPSPDRRDDMSEVTLTDFPPEENDPSNDSFCSSSSSIPSLKSDAPLLAVKEIGQNGLKFVKQLQDTQMYSNYCQSLKLHSSTTTVDGSVMNEEKIGSLDTHQTPIGTTPHDMTRHSDDEEDEEENFDSITNLFEILLTGSLPVEKHQYEDLKQIYDELYSPKDPSSIYVTPTSIPLVTGQSLVDLSKYDQDFLSRVTRVCKSRSRLQRYIKKLIKSIAISDLQSLSLDFPTSNDAQSALFSMQLLSPSRVQNQFQSPQNGSTSFLSSKKMTLRSCNGLICNGFCNTDLCSEICIQLWSAKVKKLRHHQVAYEIVSKKYEKRKSLTSSSTNANQVGNGGAGSNNEKESSVHDLKRLTIESGTSLTTFTDQYSEKTSPKVEYFTKIGPHYEISRHKRETDSQYEKRKVIAEDSIRRTSGVHGLASPTNRKELSKSGKHHRHHHHHHHRHHHRQECITAVSLFVEKPTIPASSDKNLSQKKSNYSLTPKPLPSTPAAIPTVSEPLKPSKLYLKKRKFLSIDPDSVNDPQYRISQAFAKYYSKKEEKLVKKYLHRCYERIKRIVRKYVCYYQRVKYRHSVIIVQSLIRGFLIRNNLYHTIQNYIKLRQLRLCNKIRIRNYFRHHMDAIIKSYRRRKEIEQRKRLSKISIPILPHGSANTSGASSKNNNSNNIGGNSTKMNNNNNSNAADGRLSPKSRSKSESPLPFLNKGMKYINDPTLPVEANANNTSMNSITSGLTINTNQPNSMDGRNISGKRNSDPHVALQSKDSTESMDKSLDPHEESAAAFSAPPTKKSSFYAEKAREFLQFGGILKRSSFVSNPKLPIRRKSESGVKKSDGVAIESDKDDASQHSGASTTNNNVPFQSQDHSNNSAPAGPSSLLHTFSASGSTNTMPPLPRKSVDPMNHAPGILESRSKSMSSDVDRVASQEGSLHGELSSDASLQKAISFMSISEEFDPNEPHPSGRASFLTRGLSILRSRSSDSNQSHQAKHRAANNGSNPTPYTMTNNNPHSPLGGMLPMGGSRDSYDTDLPGQLSREPSINPGETVLYDDMTHQHPVVKEKRKYSGMFSSGSTVNDGAKEGAKEGGGGGGLGLSFPSIFTYGGGERRGDSSPTRRSSRGSVQMDSNESSPNKQSHPINQIGGIPPPSLDDLRHSDTTIDQSNNSGKSGRSHSLKSTGSKNSIHDLIPEEEEATPPPYVSKRAVSLLTSENDEQEAQEEDEFKIGSDEDEDYLQRNDDFAAEFEKYPLKSLGKFAMECINRQQIAMIKRMWNILREGIEVTKHSRSGKPKGKKLFCDYAMTKLYWRSSGSKPDPVLSMPPREYEDPNNSAHNSQPISDHHSEDSNYYNPSLLDEPTASTTTAAKKERRSTLFSHAFHDPFRRSSFTKSDSEREIFFKDILAVSFDGKSEVFARSFSKQYFTSEETELLTLTVASRTLDLEVHKNDWSEILPAFQILVDYFQVSLTGHVSVRSDVRDQLNYVMKNGNKHVISSSASQSRSYYPPDGGGGGGDGDGDDDWHQAGQDTEQYRLLDGTTISNDPPSYANSKAYQRRSLQNLFPIMENDSEERR